MRFHQLKRREFIALLGGAAAAWPLAARAQQGGRVRRVGVLLFGAETDPAPFENLKVLREELKKLGWTEGGNLQLDVRFGGGDFNRTRANAAELVNLAPDAILAITGAAVDAALQQTKTIPIVQAAGDSNERGVVQNVAHPEGNITGFASGFASIGGRWLELLKEAAPSITRVAYLRRPQSESYGRYIEAAAQNLRVKITTIPVSNAGEIRQAIERFAAEPNGGLLPNPGITAIPRHEWARLAEQYRLPAIYAYSSFAADGGLMSYGSDGVELVPGAASYIDRILRGAKINDLPVQYPTRFSLVINLKAAKAIGLTVPLTLLARADEVIE
jgi:putative ABC transport system substrate-binding protein